MSLTDQDTTNPPCHYCGLLTGQVDPRGKPVEMRPYGPGGAWVCFGCAMATPEREKETESNLGAAMDAAGPVALIDTRDNFGVRPFRKPKDGH